MVSTSLRPDRTRIPDYNAMMSHDDFLTNLPAEDPVAAGSGGEPAQRPSPTRGASFRSASGQGGFTPREAIRLLFKHKWTILFPLVIFSSLGAGLAYLSTPFYQATASLQIQPNELEPLTPMATNARQRNLLNDQVQLLRSDRMLEKVVETLSLDTQMAALLEEDIESTDRVTVAIRILKERLLFIQPIIDTNYIEITTTAPSPDWAYRIPNTLAEEYVKEITSRIEQQADRLANRYDEEAARAQQELEKIEVKMSNFLSEKGIPDMGQRLESLRLQADSLDEDLRNAQREELRYERTIEVLEAELETEPETIESSTQTTVNPQYELVRRYLNDLQIERTNLLGKWKPGSKQVQTIDEQIAEAEQTLVGIEPESVAAKTQMKNPRFETIKDNLVQYRPQLAAVTEDIATLEKAIEDVNLQITEFAGLRKEYVDLVTQQRAITQQLEFAKGRAQQAQTTGQFATEIIEVKIADAARKPTGPAGPNRVLMVAFGIALGFVVGLGLAAAREVLRHNLETSEDVQKHLGVPVIGVIPEKGLRA